MGEGERGSRACWLRTNSPLCNHSFPEVALPFRSAQTDNHSPPVASLPSKVHPLSHPPLGPHQSPNTPLLWPPQVRKSRVARPPKQTNKTSLRIQVSGTPAPPNNRKRIPSILPEPLSIASLSRSVSRWLPCGFPFQGGTKFPWFQKPLHPPWLYSRVSAQTVEK